MSLYWTGTRSWEAECLRPWLQFERGITLESTHSSFPCSSVEKEVGERKLWGSGDTKTLDPLISRLLASQSTRKTTLIASYSPAATASFLSESYLWTIPDHLLALWNDKTQSSRWMQSNRLPMVPFIHFTGGQFPNEENLLVMQLLQGSCGTTTYIGERNALKIFHDSIKHPHVRLTPFIDGYIINGHIFIMPEGEISVAPPSLQLVSPTMLGKICQPLYAGNDFAAYKKNIPAGIRQVVGELLKKLGALAAREGYYGILGADLIFNPKDFSVYFLEINPRMQGSTGLLSLLETSKGKVPSAALFFRSLLNSRPDALEHVDFQSQNNTPQTAQFLLRQGVKTNFSRNCHTAHLVDESPSVMVEHCAVTHRYLTTFTEQTIHHETMLNIFNWAQQNAS